MVTFMLIRLKERMVQLGYRNIECGAVIGNTRSSCRGFPGAPAEFTRQTLECGRNAENRLERGVMRQNAGECGGMRYGKGPVCDQ